MKKTIAIVEDEPLIAENYSDFFSAQGFAVKHFSSREAAMAGLAGALPDMAIVDVGLGDEVEGGFELCRWLRSQSASLPILFLTARSSELDIISGLRLGADDYLTKDISLQHIFARVTALFRRIEALKSVEPAEVHKVGELALNAQQLTAHWRGEPVDLTVTEFWMVHALGQSPGQVKSRMQLMRAASVVLDDNTITSHIKRIRKKFVAIDAEFDAIETIYAMGYRWKAVPVAN